MKTIKTNLTSEAVYNDDETRRYTLHLERQKDSKRACVIMLKAGWTDGVLVDRTTNLVLANLAALNPPVHLLFLTATTFVMKTCFFVKDTVVSLKNKHFAVDFITIP